MKKFVSIIFLSICFSLNAMTHSTLSKEEQNKLNELERSVQQEDVDLMDSILLGSETDDDTIIVNLEASIVNDDTMQVDTSENLTPGCCSRLLNWLKKCGACCSCFWMAFFLSCAQYGENIGGGYYQRIE